MDMEATPKAILEKVPAAAKNLTGGNCGEMIEQTQSNSLFLLHVNLRKYVNYPYLKALHKP